MQAQHEAAPEAMYDIVELNSKSGLEGSNRNFAYAGSKFGGIGLTQSFALELCAYNIKVNAVCPGWIDTPLLGAMDPMMIAGIVMQIPQGRMGRPDELAELVRFLAGPESSYCNGDIFAASGGFA